jgi:hypothetical protein
LRAGRPPAVRPSRFFPVFHPGSSIFKKETFGEKMLNIVKIPLAYRVWVRYAKKNHGASEAKSGKFPGLFFGKTGRVRSFIGQNVKNWSRDES